MRAIVLLNALAIITAVVVGAERTGRAQHQAASRLVLASVTDGQNRPIVDLGPDDFVIKDNGEVREVITVYTADYPVVVLVDDSSDARSDLEAIRSAVARFVSRVAQRFVALGTLANPPAMLTAIEDERATVLARLDRLTTSPTSIVMPLEAVAAAARAVRESGSPFSAIVVVSAHRIDSAHISNTRLLPDIFENNAIVHVVSRSAPSAAPPVEADLLRDLADQTRGYFTTVFSAPSYAVALSNLADRLASEMMIEYLVAPDPVPAGEVQIGVRIPGAHVRGLGVSK